MTCTRTSTPASTTPGSIFKSKKEAGWTLRSACARSYQSSTRIVATVAQAAATEAATVVAVEEASVVEAVVAMAVAAASVVTEVAVAAEAMAAAVVAEIEEATAAVAVVAEAMAAVAVTSTVVAAAVEVAAAGQVVATHGPWDQLTWAPAIISELVAALEEAIRSQDPASRCTISQMPRLSLRHRE